MIGVLKKTKRKVLFEPCGPDLHLCMLRDTGLVVYHIECSFLLQLLLVQSYIVWW